MSQYFVLNRLLPSLVSLLIGVTASGVTLAYYRGDPLDVIVVVAFLYIFSFFLCSLLFAALFWVAGWTIIDAFGRQHFRIILLVCAIPIQLIIAVISTHELYQLGIFDGVFSRSYNHYRLLIIAIPYTLTIECIDKLLNNESEEQRNNRIATLRIIESEYQSEKSRSRTAGIILIVIFVIIGGILGWFFPVDSMSNTFTSIMFAALGIILGMVVHRYLPAQRRLRRLEDEIYKLSSPRL